MEISQAKISRINPRIYFFLFLLTVETCWLVYMISADAKYLFSHYWPATITMIFGSLVAGATAEGGAFVAFPVFTKILQLSAAQSSTFGLMIQSIGMSAASIIILTLPITILPRVIRWVTFGSAIGIIIGIKYLHIPSSYSRLIFTAIVTGFAITLLIRRFQVSHTVKNTIRHWSNAHRLIFIISGLIGGLISSQVGTGTNIVTFMVLTLMFNINEKIAVPTSVVVMAINSLVGFSTHFLNDSIGIMWNYWLVAIPVVAIGAPLGAYIAHKISRQQLVNLLLTLITIEFITTLFLVPFSKQTLLLFISAIVLVGLITYLLQKVSYSAK